MWRASDSSSARASVRWTTPDGAERTGVAEVSESTRAGDTVHVWTDADGRQSVAPAGARMSLFHAGIGAALTSGTLAAIVCLVQAGVRARIDRRRSEAWERAWAEVEPRWRHHAS